MPLKPFLPKNPISPFTSKAKPSKPFIDYLHISFLFKPEWIKSLKHKYKELFYHDLKTITQDIPKEHVHYKDNKNNLYSVIKFHNNPDGSIMIYLSKNYNISVHFKGTYFISTNEYAKDLEYLDEKIKILQNHLIQYFYVRYGTPYFETHVTRIDLAINHYQGKIYDPEKQMRFHNSVSPIKVGREKGITTSVTMSKEHNNKVYFRCYSKLHQNQEAKSFAIFRFGTDDFFRNEWEIRSNKLKKDNMKYWKDWKNLKYSSLKTDEPTFVNYMLKLRKARDVTFYPGKYFYNNIHISKQWAPFKKKKLEEVTYYEWKREQAIIGMIRKGANSMTPIQAIGIVEELNDKYPTIIPTEALQILKVLWNSKNLASEPVSKTRIDNFLKKIKSELDNEYYYSKAFDQYTR